MMRQFRQRIGSGMRGAWNVCQPCSRILSTEEHNMAQRKPNQCDLFRMSSVWVASLLGMVQLGYSSDFLGVRAKIENAKGASHRNCPTSGYWLQGCPRKMRKIFEDTLSEEILNCWSMPITIFFNRQLHNLIAVIPFGFALASSEDVQTLVIKL